MAINSHRFCVIMCGGIGSRFWPYSRTGLPKQFLDLLGTGRSLLQMSFDRITSLVKPENILVVTNEAYRPLVAHQIPQLSPNQILCEPARRNTAPCVAWAAYHIRAIDPQASLVVTPSDHLITNELNFINCLERGFEFVENNQALLTLGIKPTRPETGYGYIQIDEIVDSERNVRGVKTFTEKPQLELAKVFLESGEFFWNSGIFLWTANSIINALHLHAPDLAEIFDRGTPDFNTSRETEFIDKYFPSCPAISIDYAVMEKAANVFVETVDFGWSDLGTWGSLYDNSPKNRDRNVTQGCKVMAYNSRGNIFAVRDSDRLIVVNGLNDFIVADAGDVLLIYPRAEEQSLRNVVNDVNMAFGDKYL